ncbi:hypothetical protein NSP_46430 [Nodularia spumigena CCY9414]|nr:hypothetical protein NSP_46430 [Nodularia spumigena CCY9414]
MNLCILFHQKIDVFMLIPICNLHEQFKKYFVKQVYLNTDKEYI